MCALFGLLDFRRVLSAKKKNKILSVLSQECEVRGTDATGIAYNSGGQLRIHKRPVPAHQLRINIPSGVKLVMGHTRMTTQGSAAKNYNNHPFMGTCNGKRFALAHNGTLWNDKRLQKYLPETHVQTDSFVAVQLLEQAETLDFSSLKEMAEMVEGSFTFTVLDSDDNLYVVKGDNPLTIFSYDGFAVYASTGTILDKAIKRLHLGPPSEIYEPEEGDIVKLDRIGGLTTGNFIPKSSYSHWWRLPPYYGDYDPEENNNGLDELMAVGRAMGISPDEILILRNYGYTRDEIERLIYDPRLLHDLAAEAMYPF